MNSGKIKMRSLLSSGLFVAALLTAGQAAAQTAAVVEGVQMPAFIERDGRRSPVSPGMALKPGDKLFTGSGSRLLLKLSEGSLVKLGENGNLQIKELEPSKSVFRAALGVLEGAFRFTTAAVSKGRKREIDITVATVTAGIRGTDLWGKSSADKQIVCLIEGKIEVGAPGETPVAMDQPRQFYQRDKGTTAPLAIVEEAQLAEWAKETEIEAGKGAVRRGGKWKVELASADKQSAALDIYDQVRAAGYAAELFPTLKAEKRTYVVRIGGLPSKKEAEALAGQLRGMHGVADPKVSS
jgi:cell division septation protein DedD